MLNSELKKLDKTELKWHIHLRLKRSETQLNDLEALPARDGSPSEMASRETLLTQLKDARALDKQMRARLAELENK